MKWLKTLLDPDRPVRPWLIVLAVVYYLFSVLPHEQVGLIVAGMFKGYSRSFYNNASLGIAVVLFAIYAFLIFKALKKHPDRRRKGLIYLAINIALTIIAINLLLVLNVEAIHFVQYAILGVLLYLCFKRFDTVLWISLIGATIDEGFQFFYLAPDRTGYLDFNDIIIDQIGCGYGLISLYCLGAIPILKASVQHRFLHWLYGTIAVLTISFLATGIMRIYPNGEEHALIQLFIIDIDGFWHTVPPRVTFHVVRPLEGLIIILIYNLFIGSLSRGLNTRKQRVGEPQD